jgi:hypothetical protein
MTMLVPHPGRYAASFSPSGGPTGSDSSGGGAFFTGWQMNSGLPGFTQPDRDRLLRVTSAVLSLSNMLHLFAHEFAGLRAWGFPFGRVLSSALDRSFFWHF